MRFDILKNGKVIAHASILQFNHITELYRLGYELRLSSNLLDKVQLI